MRRISRSRVTLATIDAAAMAALFSSPSTTARCGGAVGPRRNPSTRHASAGGESAHRIDLIAARFERCSPLRSISPCGITRTSIRSAHASLPADLPTQVVQLGAVHVPDRRDVDLVDLGRVQGERPLHADSEGLLADGERLAGAGALPLQHDPLEDLNSLPLALDHLEVDAHGGRRPELR